MLGTNIDILESIASKYNLNTVQNEILKIQERNVKIGFLGEFNSGKSSLINALLGRKILPVMERPTTKNIITIVPDKSVDNPKFYKESNGEFVEIDPLDFQELALGRKEGSAVVKVPPSEYIPEGFQLLDTPGIASLKKTDIEITLGYLPELDAAVICQDITYGTFPKSVLDFLKRPEIKAIIDKIIFVFTKADRISSKEAEEARKHAISVIQELYSSLGMKLNAEQRVFITSAKLSLEGKREYVREFVEGLEREIISEREKIKKERLKKESKRLVKELIETLEYLKSQTKPDTSKIKEEIKRIEKEIYSLESEKRQLWKKLEDIELSFRKKVEEILYTHKNDILSISSEEELNQIISEIEKELQNSMENLMKRKLKVEKEVPLLVIKEAIQEVKEKIAMELKRIEFTKTILTAILFMVVGPEKGAGNAIEGLAGYFVAKGGKLVKSFRKFLSIAGEIFKVLNPVEIVVNPLAKRYLEDKYSSLVPLIASLIGENLRYEMADILEETFKELESQIRAKEDALRKLLNEEFKTIEQVKSFRMEIDQDIHTLKRIAQ